MKNTRSSARYGEQSARLERQREATEARRNDTEKRRRKRRKKRKKGRRRTKRRAEPRETNRARRGRLDDSHGSTKRSLRSLHSSPEPLTTACCFAGSPQRKTYQQTPDSSEQPLHASQQECRGDPHRQNHDASDGATTTGGETGETESTDCGRETESTDCGRETSTISKPRKRPHTQ